MSSLEKINAGKHIADDVNVVIEIPADSGPVKYEFDKDSGMICVDRFMPTAMSYPCNYGFIPHTLSDDSDPADVLVVTPYPVHPGSVIRSRVIGMLRMTDEAGEDCKLLALPIEKLCAEYAHIKSLSDLSPIVLDRIKHFFERYKELEPNKWVKVNGWEDQAAATKEIKDSIARYQAAQKSGEVTA